MCPGIPVLIFVKSERIKTIEARLDSLEEERQVLADELVRLQAEVPPASAQEATAPYFNDPAPETPTEKADLFLKLFRARESVYPKLWENPKTGKKGYAPACRNEWVRNICKKPQIKCSECSHQAFPTLDRDAVLNHLRGRHTIGTYAVREDNSCVFLAADFDGAGWQKDLLAYKDAAKFLGVQVSIERSRSGNGAHGWIFFAEPVPAVLARRMGTIIVSKACAQNPTMSLATYDRFFPNQDILPQGGFGNLIALPLQHKPRQKGNTVFLDAALSPIPDPWRHLSEVRAVTRQALDGIVETLLPSLHSSVMIAEENFALSYDDKALDLIPSTISKGLVSGEIRILHKAQLEISMAGLPSALVAALKRLATFPNPKFYELQRLRFPTYNTPRFIFCGEIHPNKLVLPRGILEEAHKLIEKAGGSSIVDDFRRSCESTSFKFQGKLMPPQRKAVKACAIHEHGVLVAPPGAGKTVMGCALIAKRRVRTLILTHRRPLLEQWKSQVMRFLGLKKKEIGLLSKKGSTRNCSIDMGMLQTLVKMENASEILSQYGHIVIDECHHVPAVSFEAVLKACSARYILGLTATPVRKDGLQKILFMQCGPVRHEIKDQPDSQVARRVLVRPTSFTVTHESERPPIHLVWEALVNDMDRTGLIVQDIFDSVMEGRRSLVLSDRKTHLTAIQQQLEIKFSSQEAIVFRLDSDSGKKERLRILSEIERCLSQGQKFVLLATSSLIGEGFDLPQLDTLFLAMPLSFKGRLVQYAGRLHRPFEGKRDVLIYDYIEPANILTMSMHRKRLSAYRQMGYRIESLIGEAEHPLFFTSSQAS